jgi:Asp/Glu/hydantoin racemase
MNPKKHVCVINTSFSNKDDVLAFFKKEAPDIRVTYMADDGLIRELIAGGGPTPGVVSRMCLYAVAAQGMGADAIVNQCSSAGDIVDIYARLVSIPVIRIDQAMAWKAVELGTRISLVATVATTVAPSRRLLERAAAERGIEVKIKECLVEGAMELLFAGHGRRHNELVRTVVEAEDRRCDVIVLAQGSMMVLMPELTHIATPVLTSIPMGVKYAAEAVRAL